MKKVLALVLAAVLLCGGLIACTKSGSAGYNRIVGTWNLTKGVSSGITIDASKLNMEMAFVFDSNGKASMIYNGETTDGLTWKLSGNVVKLGVSGVDLYDFAFDGDTLTLEQDGTKLIFEKK